MTIKIRIKLIGPVGSDSENDEQTIETSAVSNWGIAEEIIEAIKAWAIAPGDTIKIEEVE